MEILEIANKIENAGGTLYLVGGALRDRFIGKENYDEDYCVVGISAEKFEKLFPEAHSRGKFFNVYDMYNKEFAMARKEQKSGIGHKEFEIQTGKEITIQEDLKRRDITINSIAQNVITKEIIDPFNGRDDIKNKIIKATSNAFLEDPLRVYRVARFAAQLDFKIEENTIKMMNDLKNELNSLSEERVFVEFRKALASEKPSIFFNVLKQAQVLDIHFKEIYDLIGNIQPKEPHPEGDSYNHTMIVLDKSAQLTDNLQIRFSCLVHDLGKGTTPIQIRPHHYGHEERGVELVKQLGKRLKIPNTWTKCGKVAAKEHMRGGKFNEMTTRKKVDFITRIDKSILGLDGMKIVVMCDRFRNGKIDREIIFDEVGKECLEKINGEYIKTKYNIESSRQLGELLRKERIFFLDRH